MTKKLVIFSSFLFVTAVIVSTTYFESNPQWVQTGLFISLLCWLLFINIIKKPASPHQFLEQEILSSLSINIEDGLVVTDDKSYFISPNSRVGLLGCWLMLQSETTKRKTSVKRYFIYHDSLEPESYSRLCRFIYRHNAQINENLPH